MSKAVNNLGWRTVLIVNAGDGLSKSGTSGESRKVSLHLFQYICNPFWRIIFIRLGGIREF